MNIFVGNLNYSSLEDSVRALFEPYGEVNNVKIITSPETGRSRGFAFVEMPDEEEAKAAIKALDGKELDRRPLKINQARERTVRPLRY